MFIPRLKKRGIFFAWVMIAFIAAASPIAATELSQRRSIVDISSLGHRGYESDVFADLAEGSHILAEGTVWTVANSSIWEWDTGSAGFTHCRDTTGTRKTNPYPLRIYRSPSVTISGAAVRGEVPQGTAWGKTYCNSAAIAVFDSDNATVKAARVDSAWDAVRFAERKHTADNQTVQRVWVTRNRDDCIESDWMVNLRVVDVLCESFVGVSASNKRISRPENTVVLIGAIFSMLEYDYRGNLKSGPPVKLRSEKSIGLVIENSVFVLNATSIVGERNHFDRLRASLISCENNLLIWPHDQELAAFVDLPECFSIITGKAEGTQRWEEIRTNWINCHHEVPRSAGDPASDPASCDETDFGRRY